jgi:hypothetical protein
MKDTPSAPANKRALAAVDTPPTGTPVESPRRISKKVITAIDALVAGECKTIKDAAEKDLPARASARH